MINGYVKEKVACAHRIGFLGQVGAEDFRVGGFGNVGDDGVYKLFTSLRVSETVDIGGIQSQQWEIGDVCEFGWFNWRAGVFWVQVE